MYKNIDTITMDNLQELIDDEVQESIGLEYKKEIPIDSGDHKKEFLADVSAFANAYGGLIIYGIEENRETNLPCKLCGINNYETEDELIRKVESLLRDGIMPRMLNVKCRMLTSPNLKILLISIPQSINAPHMVTYGGSSRFYKRNSKGKYQMDVNELRAAFNLSENIIDRMSKYKKERLMNFENDLNLGSGKGPYFVLQYLPISAFSRPQVLAVDEIRKAMLTSDIDSFGLRGRYRVIVDGVSIIDNMGQAVARYINNGVVEKISTGFFCRDFNHTPSSKTINLIYAQDLANEIAKSIKKDIDYFKSVSMQGPIVISGTIVNGRGFTIPSGGFFDVYGEIDRDLLMLPDVVVENLNGEVDFIIRQLLDSIWNACGYNKCSLDISQLGM
jgi:Predicted transcriptional regulator containing an HTH domain and an uncharacterized domain shared with the mammalian protein Schlafen